jgi:uncharacterized membrane protein
MHVLATHLFDASMHVASRVPATPPINLEGPTKVGLHIGWFMLTAANLTMILLLIAVFLFGIFVPFRGNKKVMAKARGEVADTAPATPASTDPGAGAA